MTERRTKRRYAHELFPHAKEGVPRPLEEEVPYRIARAVGFDVQGTSWFDDVAGGKQLLRMAQHMNEARIAMLAIALHRGLAGDEAWAWAERGQGDGEMWGLYEAAPAYGVDVHAIKPYPCGPEPDYHLHFAAPRPGDGARMVTQVAGRESECEECTEPIPVENVEVAPDGR